ncbi:hypothetical protein [Halomonas huangheensis]|uniref:Uncharacterized protein n=1 Tax=Halomonas huangheensis TaxID=1178482 RepID=W1N3H2_9GAMM|nr:hypothetical protein [Halomonas huangheensis]ALM51630.1 hypothetical protein AR456_04510 [Halomonas huangheensis]ERL50112.1 hypothetical protein BJB45_03025 [Halomonas huangheensis]
MKRSTGRRWVVVLGASMLLTAFYAVAAEDPAIDTERLPAGVTLPEFEVINDNTLEQVRGRYIPHTDTDIGAVDGVILWDERPGRDAGGGGSGVDHRAANGLNNLQRVSVTAQRNR